MLIKYLYTILKAKVDSSPKPWDKGNGFAIGAKITDIQFDISEIAYLGIYADEKITAGITDLVFAITEV
jgi:hypothetical protein